MTGSMRDAALARRDKAVTMAMKRKEEYLGARVPKELRDRVICRAAEMGVPVSILIRKILEDAFGAGGGGDVVDEVREVADVQGPSAGRFDSVLGWERIVLNRAVPCSDCGVQLAAGKNVTLGLGAAQPVILCDRCKSAI